MSLQIIACVKQVPGTAQVEIDPETGTLKRDGALSKLNPYDLFSLEMAISLVERAGGGVRTLTMGPPQAKAALLETVYMGADSGVLVSDRRFAGADVLATAYTLCQAVRLMGPYDLILCGKQTTDGDTAQVGAELAELLGVPCAGNVLSIEPDENRSVTVTVGLDDSVVVQRIPLPCLLSMEGEVNTPRLPSYRRKKALSAEPIRMLTLDDFDDRDESHYGLSGSPTQVERIFPPKKSGGREIFTGSGPELGNKLADILISRKFI